MAGLASLAVETLLLSFARVGLVIFPRTLRSPLATVILSAAERATEILSFCVARMRQEANPAVATSHRARLQFRSSPHHGFKRELILAN